MRPIKSRLRRESVCSSRVHLSCEPYTNVYPCRARYGLELLTFRHYRFGLIAKTSFLSALLRHSRMIGGTRKNISSLKQLICLVWLFKISPYDKELKHN